MSVRSDLPRDSVVLPTRISYAITAERVDVGAVVGGWIRRRLFRRQVGVAMLYAPGSRETRVNPTIGLGVRY